MYYVDHYVIDWEKVQTFDDLKRLVAAMNISFERDFDRLDVIKDLVRLEPKPAHKITYD